MGGNSFSTHDGATVTGAVAMALDDSGKAVPIEAETEIGTVRVKGLNFSLDQFCRALAAHASVVRGGDASKHEVESLAKQILDFARKGQP